MKTQSACFLAATLVVHAGEPESAAITSPAGEYWIKPSLEIRARYEFGDVNGADPSHSLTLRERVGLKTKEWNGLSAFIEGEFAQAVIDDYHGGAPLAHPAVLNNTVIADPENNELNQAFFQYSGYGAIARLGRQRIIYDNAAFIGNVGWRQNEQTYDGISFSIQSIEDLTLNYAYINQVNRIFGADAGGVLENMPGDIHLFNASCSSLGGITVGAYIYLMEFDDLPGWDNNTFGISAKGDFGGISYHGEIAFQDKAGPLNDLDALYTHVSATRTLGGQSFTLGVEHLDAGFQTPLATLHAFNGFADVFIAGRTTGTHGGITNAYLSHTLPVFHGIKWTNVLHAFGDNSFSTNLGWEYDSVLMKKFGDHFTAIAKFSHFETESNLPTTTRFSLELNYSF